MFDDHCVIAEVSKQKLASGYANKGGSNHKASLLLAENVACSLPGETARTSPNGAPIAMVVLNLLFVGLPVVDCALRALRLSRWSLIGSREYIAKRGSTTPSWASYYCYVIYGDRAFFMLSIAWVTAWFLDTFLMFGPRTEAPPAPWGVPAAVVL